MHCIHEGWRGKLAIGTGHCGQNLGLPSLWVTERVQSLSYVLDDHCSESLSCTHPHAILHSRAEDLGEEEGHSFTCILRSLQGSVHGFSNGTSVNGYGPWPDLVSLSCPCDWIYHKLKILSIAKHGEF